MIPSLLRRNLFVLFTMLNGAALQAQDAAQLIGIWLQENSDRLHLTTDDASNWTITSSHTDKNDVEYVYIQQHVNGLPVHGAVANFAIKDHAVIVSGYRLIGDLSRKVPAPITSLDAKQALYHAARHLGRSVSDVQILRSNSATDLELSPSGISHDPIPARLIYQPTDGGSELAWELTIRSTDSPNWWRMAIDAASGAVLRSNDLIVHCDHPGAAFTRPYDALQDLALPAAAMAAPPPPDGSSYRVFPFPIESPSHGPYTLVNDPANEVASPYGWHDTNGADGYEYSTTRGNNVYASEDIDDTNFPGYSPDGGPSLNFDFSFNQAQSPVQYLDASITNLFYACNVLHDVWYHYGFTEQSGNFQFNNYDHGGDDGDHVMAEGQDGGGMNNANFGTPPDGGSGRMQMYLYRLSADSTLFINSPASLIGEYDNVIAGFGPPLSPTPLTADIALVEDATAPVNDGCETITNAAAIAGKIALVDRGLCTFVYKVETLQSLGAVAVIVINNVPGAPIGMGGTGGDFINIPSVMISQADGELIKLALLNGTVNATLVGGEEELRDSDLDNGIIAHEYGHGVSNRLTGGAMDADCLYNQEQMGEGWSDYMAIVLTMLPGDLPETPRGKGTYVMGQETTGGGSRPAPYSTDFAVNDYTYGDTNDPSLTQPHGVGFVWATMLWDLTWALIDEHGLDPNMYTGTGGNNMAIQLMMDGLKLQPCSPGFVDGRDAILLADQLNNGGENECIIWNAFAQRGLGFSADQGSSYDRFDQVEAFDVPPACLNVGISDRANISNGLTLIPNPASDQVSIEVKEPLRGDGTIRILGADGRIVKIERIATGSTRSTFDVGDIAPGLYVIELHVAEEVLKERLLIN